MTNVYLQVGYVIEGEGKPEWEHLGTVVESPEFVAKGFEKDGFIVKVSGNVVCLSLPITRELVEKMIADGRVKPTLLS